MTKWILEKKIRVISAGILIVAIPLVSLSLFIYFSFSNSLMQSKATTNGNIAEQLAHHIEQKLESDISFGKAYTSRPLLIQALQRNDKEEMVRHIKDLIGNSKNIERVFMASTKGILLADYPSAVPSVIGQNRSDKDWFREISINWVPYVSEYYLRGAQPQRYLFAIAIPVKDERNKPLGILVMQPKDSYIKDAIGGVDVAIPNGFIYMVDKNGSLIHHSQYPMDRIKDFSEFPVVRKLMNNIQTAEVIFDPISKENILVTSHSLGKYRWGIVLQMPSREVLRPINKTVLGLITVTGIMILLGGFFAYIGAELLVSERNIRKVIKNSEKKLQDITSSLGEGVYVIDEYGKVTFMNPEAESLLGWTQAELAVKNIHDVVHNHKPDGSLLLWDNCPMHKVISTGERYDSHDEIFIRKDGTSFPVSVISSPVIEDNKVIASVTSFTDITEIKETQDALNRANKLLELQATTDSLTGIFNRFKFDEVLIKELSRSKRYNIPLSLVMFDIDYFKNINDTFGHHTGDIVLKKLTAHISKSIRSHDYFVRWGGEEFIILLTHTTLEPAVQFAENCRIQTEELKIGGLEGLTCSFGVTELKDDDNIFSFAKRVDEALYKAKSGGRNRVEKL